MIERTVSTLSAAAVRTEGGDPLGPVAQVYVDASTGRPEWITVRTGRFGAEETFVPLTAAWFDGHELVVRPTLEQVTGAPRVAAGGGLTEDLEAEVHRHYGVPTGTEAPAALRRHEGAAPAGDGRRSP